MSFVLKDDQMVDVTIQFLDKFGNITTPPATPTWADATDQCVLTVSDDGMSCNINANGKIGTTQINVDAGGVHGVLDLQVVPGDAVTVVINPGTPVTA